MNIQTRELRMAYFDRSESVALRTQGFQTLTVKGSDLVDANDVVVDEPGQQQRFNAMIEVLRGRRPFEVES